ncbi:MAG: PEGA domain-containing protein [Myxococcales bacterium]|nr:PEGA domain-containing protein [Myxococcales bacterium]
MVRTAVLLITAMALSAIAQPALAAAPELERTVVLVELRNGPDASSLTVDYLKEIRKSFQTQNKGDFILVKDATVIEKVGANRQQVPPALTAERLATLDEAKKKGVAYLDQADAANAVKALRSAESKFRAALAAPGANDALRKSYLDLLAKLATAYVISKDPDAAAEVFRTVVTAFGPSAPVTDDHYRPDVVEIFQRVLKEMKKLPHGSIDVSSTPLGAKVILGGIARGRTPSQVSDLIPGNYSLRLQRGANTSMLHRVRVDAGKASKIHIDLQFESHLVLEDTHAGLSYKDLEAAKQRAALDAVSLGRLVEGANLVVAVGVFDRKLVTFVIDVNKSRSVRRSSSRIPQVGISKRAVTRSIDTIMNRSIGGSDGQAWYTSVPGWAATGAGVVSLGVGLAFVSYLDQSSITVHHCVDAKNSCAESEKKDPALQNQINAAKQTYKDEIGTNSTISGIGLGLGTILIGAGAYLFYRHMNSSEMAAMRYAPAPGDPTSVLPPMNFGFARTQFSAGGL